MIRFATLVAVAVLLPAAAARGQPASEVTYNLVAEGQVVGRMVDERRVRPREVVSGRTLRVDVDGGRGVQHLRLVETFRESRDGSPLSFTRHVRAGGVEQRVESVRRGGEWRVDKRSTATAVRFVLSMQQDVWMPQRLADWVVAPRDAADTAQFAWWDAGRDGFVGLRATIEAEAGAAPRFASVGDGTALTLRWLPESQRVFAPLRLWGWTIDAVPCADACDATAVEPLDLIGGVLVALPYRISASAAQETLRFVLEASGPAGVAPVTTDEQRVDARGTRWVVTVCADCGDEPAPSDDVIEGYRSPNRWVQSDHPELRAAARDAAPVGTLLRRMDRLVDAVQRRLRGTVDVLGYDSALGAQRSRNGDCTEYALLLAAYARALGIPARVVFGIAYSGRFTGRTNVFSPHAWVQAWDGSRWVSFDAGLDGFDSTHIALAIGDGTPAGFRGMMEHLRGLRIVAAGRVTGAAASPPGG